MKKLFLLVLIIITNTIVLFSANIRDKETQEEVKIESSTAQNDRSSGRVICLISRYTQVLEVNYHGIGLPIIYIYDCCGNLYDCQLGTMNSGKLFFDLPKEEGNYQIVIQSDLYFGVGGFLIY